MVINNTTKSVIVLKAMGMPNLRLFPGYNRVKEEGLEHYFHDNKAALAQKEKNLKVVELDAGDIEGRNQAKKAEEKNARLNKAQRVIKAQNEKIANADDTIGKLESTISDQASKLVDLGVLIENMQAELAEMKSEEE